MPEAMRAGELVELCTAASLVGRAAAGGDAIHHVKLSGQRVETALVDRDAYKDLDVATGPARGPANAPVTIVQFLDPADGPGFGARALATLDEVLAQRPKQVRVVVKPVAMHGHELVPEAVLAADAQGAAWPMLAAIAADRTHVDLESLVAHARALGLDADRFRRDLETHAFGDTAALFRDQEDAMEIHALPSAIVGGKRVHGAVPATEYLRAIDGAPAP
jgi:protein-disulfide isomerase